MSRQREGADNAVVRWFVTICDHLLLTQSPRSLPIALALTLVPGALILALFAQPLFQPVPFPLDGHASIELDEALVARYCGRPASLSSEYRMSAALRSNQSLSAKPLSDLLVARAGSLDGYCGSANLDYLNNENSLGLLMRLGLRLLPHPSARSLLYFLDAVRFSCVLFVAFALLDAGASLVLACFVAWAMTRLGIDMAGFDYSMYSFFVPLLGMAVAAYAVLWRRVRDGRYGRLLGGSLLMGFVTAFCANMRSSHLPMYLAMFVVFLVAVGRITTKKRRLVIAAAFAVFMLGYVGFNRAFIKPMVPKGSQALSYHVIFHPLVLALAVPENQLSRREGIVWDDSIGSTLAHRMVPDAVYLQPSYEKGLFLYYLKLWLLYPSEMRSIYLQKFRLAGTGMFHWNADWGSEPMATALGYVVPSPSGLTLLAVYFLVSCGAAGLFLWRPRPLPLFLWATAAVALLMQIEAGVIMSYFYPQYDGYLLVFTFLLGPIAAQLVLDGIGEVAARTGSPSPAQDGQAALQRQTIADFGEQWTTYVDNSGYYGSAALFDDVFSPFLTADALNGRIVAEIGAGTGRFVNILLQAGAMQVVAVEPSDATSVLEQNLPPALKDRVEIVRATGEAIPGTDRFDYVFSIGVLHHIPEPDAVCRAAYHALRPAGTMGIWLYGREGNAAYLALAEPMRWVTRRLPHAALAGLVWVIGWGLDAYIVAARVLPVPLRGYARNVLARLSRDKRRLVIYDQLNPAYAKYYTKSEAEALLSRAGFQHVRSHHRHGYSWTVVGEKPA